MAAYCTFEDLQEQESDEILLQLSWDGDASDTDPAAIDMDVVNKAITSASSIIDGYVGSRYNIPLSATPELINTVAVDLSLYQLYKRRKRLSMPESIETSYKNAIALLKGIAKGEISIDADLIAGDVKSATIITNKTAADRVYTKSFLAGY